MKPTRIVDEALLEAVRMLPCFGCVWKDPTAARASIDDPGVRSHPHHLISRGAGGNDVAVNVLPLCFHHHREIHSKGLVWFSREYPVVEAWLEGAGWEKELEYDPQAGLHGGYFLKAWTAPRSCYSI